MRLEKPGLSTVRVSEYSATAEPVAQRGHFGHITDGDVQANHSGVMLESN